MRPLKFRAYDKTNHRMRQVSELNLDKGYIWCPTETTLICLHGEQFELMQFTGLLDKNGKEIYEGDIIKADWGQGELIAEIMFEDGAFVLGIRDDCYRDMAGEDNNLHYEVIGNIY